MFSFLTGSIAKYLLIGAAVVIGGLSLLVYFLNNQVDILTKDLAVSEANNATLEGAITAQTKTIAQLRERQIKTQKELTELGDALEEAQLQREAIATEYNAYRGRLSVIATKKSGLLSRKATSATAKVLKDFEEATTHAPK